jgi:hypothetical protein
MNAGSKNFVDIGDEEDPTTTLEEATKDLQRYIDDEMGSE